MVVPIEFKREDTKLLTALGQLVNRMRHTFQQQPDRQQGFGVIIAMQCIEVFRFVRQQNLPLQIQRSGAQVQGLHTFAHLHHQHMLHLHRPYACYRCSVVLCGCQLALQF